MILPMKPIGSASDFGIALTIRRRSRIGVLIVGLLLLASPCFLGECGAQGKETDPAMRRPGRGQNPEERAKEMVAASHLVEAVLASGDMTFKMPVLNAALRRNDPDWELRMQQIIKREQWAFAKVHFIHLYWGQIATKDEKFMARMLDFVRAYRLSDDTLGIVDAMLQPEHPSTELEHSGLNGGPIPFGISGQEGNICEAVFRWQFSHIPSEQQERARVYFLQIGGSSIVSDPSDGFIDRFADNKRPVRPVSACNPWMGPHAVDKNSGERGLIFRVTHFIWKTDSEVDVKGGSYEAASSASGNTYSLRKDNGSWKVTNEKTNWISKD
jgi:hypothetical protein